MPAQVYLDQVQNAYIAYYGRPADPGGQAYWAGKLEEVGGSLTALVNQFGNSDEFNAFAGGKTNSELINQLYINLFNRSADSAGLNWYADEVSAGRKTIATIALDVLNGATGVDTATLAAKFQAANAFTAALDTPSELGGYNANSLTSVKTWLKGITTQAESTQAVADINTNLPKILLIDTSTAGGSTHPIAISSAGTTAATAANDIFNIASNATYSNTITGFDVTKDKLSLGTGVTASAINIDNSADDGAASFSYSPDRGTHVATITLTGLTSAQDISLTTVSGWNAIFA